MASHTGGGETKGRCIGTSKTTKKTWRNSIIEIIDVDLSWDVYITNYSWSVASSDEGIYIIDMSSTYGAPDAEDLIITAVTEYEEEEATVTPQTLNAAAKRFPIHFLSNVIHFSSF